MLYSKLYVFIILRLYRISNGQLYLKRLELLWQSKQMLAQCMYTTVLACEV